VFEIKQLLRDGTGTQQEIAHFYGVTHQSISDINVGNTWRHVELP
jgi:predicted XRE-type DNA-binding protein